MHYSRAVQFSEEILIFVGIYLYLVTTAFATFPPAHVQQATLLTSFLIHPSQLIEANLFVDLFLVLLHPLPSCISVMGFVSCLEQVGRGEFLLVAAEMKTF